MTLDKVKRGCKCRILRVALEEVRAQAMRMGLCEGEMVECYETIPSGPVVVKKNRQEIAIGRGLARLIEVSAN